MERCITKDPRACFSSSSCSIILNALLPFLLLLGAGCTPADEGFRFQGRYRAAISGFDVQIVSEGTVAQGSDTAGSVYAVVRICPTARSNARAIRMTLLSAPGRAIEMEAEELGPVFMEWNAKSAEGLMRGMLSAANFRNIDPDELTGAVTVIGRSLAGPRGAAARDQAGPLLVLEAEVEDGYPVETDAPPREWISLSEVAACTPQ